MATELKVRRLCPTDTDLPVIVSHINGAEWDEPTVLQVEVLRTFLVQDSNIFLIASHRGQIVGTALAYKLAHPDGEASLYVDEVDTVTSFRRQGVATAIMQAIRGLALVLGVSEFWLIAENGNEPAQQLYRKLKPTKSAHAAVYDFSTKTDNSSRD